MIEIKEFYANDESSSVAIVEIGEEKVEVKFWGTYTAQLADNEELEAYILAEAHKKLGNIPQAKATLISYVSGQNNEQTEIVEIDGRQISQTTGLDNRNWAQIWIDKN